MLLHIGKHHIDIYSVGQLQDLEKQFVLIFNPAKNKINIYKIQRQFKHTTSCPNEMIRVLVAKYHFILTISRNTNVFNLLSLQIGSKEVACKFLQPDKSKYSRVSAYSPVILSMHQVSILGQ